MPNKAKPIKTSTTKRPSNHMRGYGTQHVKMRRILLSQRPFCEIAYEGICTVWSEEAHHERYGIGLSLDDYKAVCRACHRHHERAK